LSLRGRSGRIRRRALLGVALLIAVALGLGYSVSRRWPRCINAEQLGAVRHFPPWWRERGFVYVLSGSDGWSRADAWTALSYAAADNDVIGIDTPRLLRYLNGNAGGCVYMAGLFEDYARDQQSRAGTPQYFAPWVLARGTGASLAYLGQIGAPPLALGAAVLLDPEPRIPLAPPACQGYGTPAADGSQQRKRSMKHVGVEPERARCNSPGCSRPS
jgi:type IV secretory pathway VirJ component